MTRTSNSNLKPAAKKAGKASKVTQEDGDEVIVPVVSPNSTPIKKKPGKVSKFAKKSAVVVKPKLAKGHYCSVCEIKGDLLLTWYTVVGKDKMEDPFTKPLKDYVDVGLKNHADGMKGENQKFVEDTRIIMQCSRRNPDGSKMKQKSNSPFDWMQCVHQIPEEVKDRKKYRNKILGLMVNKMMDLQKGSEYPQQYQPANDLTQDPLEPACVKIPDSEVADLILAFYEIKTAEDVKEFGKCEQMMDFFSHSGTGEKALITKINMKV